MTPESIPLLQPKTTPYKAHDAGGLYLLVNQAGKYWRFDYRFDGKRKTLALGVFPDVSLATAREDRDEMRWQLLKGIDPSQHRKDMKRAMIDEQTRQAHGAARFAIGDDGTLMLRLGPRRQIDLTPDETTRLRAFLAATKVKEK